jgi:hypothetical protein
MRVGRHDYHCSPSVDVDFANLVFETHRYKLREVYILKLKLARGVNLIVLEVLGALEVDRMTDTNFFYSVENNRRGHHVPQFTECFVAFVNQRHGYFSVFFFPSTGVSSARGR